MCGYVGKSTLSVVAVIWKEELVVVVETVMMDEKIVEVLEDLSWMFFATSFHFLVKRPRQYSIEHCKLDLTIYESLLRIK